MVDVINVHDLPEEDVKRVQDYVEMLRDKGKKNHHEEAETIEFGEWPLGVKGTLTRSELYEDR